MLSCLVATTKMLPGSLIAASTPAGTVELLAPGITKSVRIIHGVYGLRMHTQ